MAQFSRKFERMQKCFLIYYYNIATAKADGLIVCDSDIMSPFRCACHVTVFC